MLPSRLPAIRWRCLILLLFLCFALHPSKSSAQEISSSVEKLRLLLEEQRVAIERDRKALNADCGAVSSDDTPKIQECQARHADVSRRMQKYKADLAAFSERRATLEEIESELSIIDKRIATTRRELSRYADEAQLKDYEASLDEWAKLAVAAREKARHAAVEGLLTLALELGSLSTDKKMELTKEAIENLSKKDYQKFLSDLEKHASRILQKNLSIDLNSLRDKAVLLQVLKALKDEVAGIQHLELRDREEALTLSLKLVEIVNSTLINNPGIALLVLDGEVGTAAIYGWTGGLLAQQRVRQLVEVGEAQLKALDALTTLYRKDIDKRKGLLEKRDNILGEASKNK